MSTHDTPCARILLTIVTSRCPEFRRRPACTPPTMLHGYPRGNPANTAVGHRRLQGGYAAVDASRGSHCDFSPVKGMGLNSGFEPGPILIRLPAL